jgi:hypothetical protein
MIIHQKISRQDWVVNDKHEGKDNERTQAVTETALSGFLHEGQAMRTPASKPMTRSTLQLCAVIRQGLGVVSAAVHGGIQATAYRAQNCINNCPLGKGTFGGGHNPQRRVMVSQDVTIKNAAG